MVEVLDLVRCDHRHLDFVESAQGAGQRHYIYICQDCGKILISAFQDGVSFSLAFHINVERQVAMINKWPAWILEGENPVK